MDTVVCPLSMWVHQHICFEPQISNQQAKTWYFTILSVSSCLSCHIMLRFFVVVVVVGFLFCFFWGGLTNKFKVAVVSAVSKGSCVHWLSKDGQCNRLNLRRRKSCRFCRLAQDPAVVNQHVLPDPSWIRQFGSQDSCCIRGWYCCVELECLDQGLTSVFYILHKNTLLWTQSSWQWGECGTESDEFVVWSLTQFGFELRKKSVCKEWCIWSLNSSVFWIYALFCIIKQNKFDTFVLLCHLCKSSNIILVYFLWIIIILTYQTAAFTILRISIALCPMDCAPVWRLQCSSPINFFSSSTCGLVNMHPLITLVSHLWEFVVQRQLLPYQQQLVYLQSILIKHAFWKG